MEQMLLDIQTKMQEKPADGFLPLSSSFQAHRVAISSLCSDFTGCVISGPKGSGKSHLFNVCRQYLEEIVKDDILVINSIKELPNLDTNVKYLLIDNIFELSNKEQELLFHWFNHLKEFNGKIILVFEKDFEEMIELNDLRSRLLTLQQANLGIPNEKDLEIFIMKQAFDRQLQLGEDVLGYLSLRVERNFNTIANLMEKLDKESLREHRKITVPFIKKFI